jgi:hypothetical protein
VNYGRNETLAQGRTQESLIQMSTENKRVTHDIGNTVLESHAMLRQDKDEEILRWLSTAFSISNYKAARDKHVAETGNWFLNSNAFKSWKTDPNSFLWIHGIAGCGKTILRYVRYELCTIVKYRF